MSSVIPTILAAALVAAASAAPAFASDGHPFIGVDDAAIGGGIDEFSYYGHWQHLHGIADGRNRGTSSRSNALGDQMRFRFLGDAVRLYAVCGPAGGNALIAVDGGKAVAVSFFAPRITPHALVYSADHLVPRRLHNLVAVVSGERPARSFGHFVNIDEVVVKRPGRMSGMPVVSPARTAEETVSPWYAGDFLPNVAATLGCIAAGIFAYARRRKSPLGAIRPAVANHVRRHSH